MLLECPTYTNQFAHISIYNLTCAEDKRKVLVPGTVKKENLVLVLVTCEKYLCQWHLKSTCINYTRKASELVRHERCSCYWHICAGDTWKVPATLQKAPMLVTHEKHPCRCHVKGVHASVVHKVPMPALWYINGTQYTLCKSWHNEEH